MCVMRSIQFDVLMPREHHGSTSWWCVTIVSLPGLQKSPDWNDMNWASILNMECPEICSHWKNILPGTKKKYHQQSSGMIQLLQSRQRNLIKNNKKRPLVLVDHRGKQWAPPYIRCLEGRCSEICHACVSYLASYTKYFLNLYSGFLRVFLHFRWCCYSCCCGFYYHCVYCLGSFPRKKLFDSFLFGLCVRRINNEAISIHAVYVFICYVYSQIQ